MDTTPTIGPDARQSKRAHRTPNACDSCKASKVKCDGKLPCSHCRERGRSGICRYTIPRRRRPAGSLPHLQERTPPPGRHAEPESAAPPVQQVLDPACSRTAIVIATPPTTRAARTDGESTSPAVREKSLEVAPDDNTDVPREAQLMCGVHGKMIFLGDCALLSFLQLVRKVITSYVGENAFDTGAGQHSILEMATAQQSSTQLKVITAPPEVGSVNIVSAVTAYLATTAGILNLFDSETLIDDLLLWATQEDHSGDMNSVVNFLVLAIGFQQDNPELSQNYFDYARNQAYGSLDSCFTVEAVKAFLLITFYLLCSCQINGAFLCFGVAVRVSYSIGLHRTEINARFGLKSRTERDRLWKSLRITDICLSSLLGRPAAAMSVDCTVPNQSLDANGNQEFDLLDASIQILIITEDIIMEIYSRKKISLLLIEGVSRQLRDWSAQWMPLLQDAITQPAGENNAQLSGACHILTCYHYSIMLVCRPFLMAELCRRLSDGPSSAARSTTKSKLADACIDAAILMVDCITHLIEGNQLNGKVPLLVLRLFASALIVGIGLFGGFGRILEKYMRLSIQALDHFAKNDNHAAEYSLITQSLLTTALQQLDRYELQRRMQCTKSTNLLFGLTPLETLSVANATTQRMRATDMGNGNVSTYEDGALLGDIHNIFLDMTDQLSPTSNADCWGLNLGDDSSFNLFPL